MKLMLEIPVNKKTERILNNIRWRHIDIEPLLTELLKDYLPEMINELGVTNEN